MIQPASGYVLGFGDPGECTVTETDAGGAIETSYACVGSGIADQSAASAWASATAVNPDDPCQTSGPQSGPIAVDIVSPSQAATVTVTNTLVAPAAAQVVQPRFTG